MNSVETLYYGHLKDIGKWPLWGGRYVIMTMYMYIINSGFFEKPILVNKYVT